MCMIAQASVGAAGMQTRGRPRRMDVPGAVGGMTPAQVRALRQIPAILRRDVALTDTELATMTGLTRPELRAVLMVLYRRRQVDFAAGFVIAPPPAGQEVEAA